MLRHGTRSTYNLLRCRCLPCKAAANTYRRSRYLTKSLEAQTNPHADILKELTALRIELKSMDRMITNLERRAPRGA